MDFSRLEKVTPYEWRVAPAGPMRVPAVLYASEALVRDMEDKVLEQITNVAALPGIQKAAYAMPDAHWGYGFPIGGVAAFDADADGVISAGGVGFDISCGVRLLRTGLKSEAVRGRMRELADALFHRIPAGVGRTGWFHLDDPEMDAMLGRGAGWAVSRGYGRPEDLECIEERGTMPDARPEEVSARAKKRQKDEMGTLGSGNHYLEVQGVEEIFDPAAAATFGIGLDDAVVSIHCGSRGLGHQIGTEFLKEMVIAAPGYGLHLPDRELACAPIRSELGERYLGAMRAAINCALANRQILTHLTRSVFTGIFDNADLTLLYDVSHNTCKIEVHEIKGQAKRLFVHRKGATRALGPGSAELPSFLRDTGQPVLVGGTMGTASYILVGTGRGEEASFSSSCHGAGRQMSRREAARRWSGRAVVDELAERGILVRSPSQRGVAEEAPGAYKDVSAVVDAADQAGISRKVARLEPMICIKG